MIAVTDTNGVTRWVSPPATPVVTSGFGPFGELAATVASSVPAALLGAAGAWDAYNTVDAIQILLDPDMYDSVMSELSEPVDEVLFDSAEEGVEEFTTESLVDQALFEGAMAAAEDVAEFLLVMLL